MAKNNIIDYSLLAGIHWSDIENKSITDNNKFNRYLSSTSPKHKKPIFGTCDHNILQNRSIKRENKENNISISSLPKIVEARSEGDVRKTNFVIDSAAESVVSAYNIKIDLSEISTPLSINNVPINSEIETFKQPLYDVKLN